MWLGLVRGVTRLGDVPGQEFSDSVHRVIGNARQDLAQIGLRIEAVEFGRADQAVDGGSALAAGIGAGEKIILPVMRRFT